MRICYKPDYAGMKYLVLALFVYPALASHLRHTKANGEEPLKLKLKNYHNIQYSGDLTVGGQTLPVSYDTGSLRVILLSTLCSNCHDKLPKYDSKLSKTFSDLHELANLSFAMGNVEGAEGKETLQVGDASSSLSVEKFPFWQVKDNSLRLWKTDSTIFSGIVGLSHSSFHKHGDQKVPVFLDSLKTKSFSLCLERGAVGEAPPGWLTFGQRREDFEQYGSSTWQKIDITGERLWSTDLQGLKIDVDGMQPLGLFQP